MTVTWSEASEFCERQGERLDGGGDGGGLRSTDTEVEVDGTGGGDSRWSTVSGAGSTVVVSATAGNTGLKPVSGMAEAAGRNVGGVQ